MAFSSGVFLPMKFLQQALINVSKFMPQYYFVKFLQEINFEKLIRACGKNFIGKKTPEEKAIINVKAEFTPFTTFTSFEIDTSSKWCKFCFHINNGFLFRCFFTYEIFTTSSN